MLSIDKTKIVGDKAYIIDFENKYIDLIEKLKEIKNVENIDSANLNLIYERVYILLILSDKDINLTKTIISISSTGSYILVTPTIYNKYHQYQELLIKITDNQNFMNYINIENMYCGSLKHGRFSKLINYYINVNRINNSEFDIDTLEKLPIIPNYDSCSGIKFRFQRKISNNIKMKFEKKRNIFFGGYVGHMENYGIDSLLKTNDSIIVWMGSDILKVFLSEKYYSIIKNKKDILHIGISKNICAALNYMNVSYKYCLMPTIFEKPYINNLYNERYDINEKNKNNIYCYDSRMSLVYNYYIIKHLQKKLKQFNFIILSEGNRITREKLLKVYKSSFIGIRLTDFDGNARTVLEMGILGKKVISNIGYPNCIRWKGLEDLEKSIIDEYNKEIVYYHNIREECYNLFKSHELIENKLLNI